MNRFSYNQSSKELIEIKSYGEVTIKNICETVSQIEHIYYKTGATKVLKDAREEILQLDISDSIQLESSNAPVLLKLAILVNNKNNAAEQKLFSNLLKRKRGYQVQIFNSRTDALHWLLGGSRVIRYKLKENFCWKKG